MFQRLDNRAGHYLLLLALGALLFLPNLGGPSLWDVDEGRNATAAFEMLESDNWIVPKFNSELRSHKPILLYWLQAAAYSLFGVNEFAARLPSALAGILGLLFAYELGRALFGSAAGLLGAVILGSSVMYCAAGHFANPDALLCTSVLLTMWMAWLAWDRDEPRWFIASGAAAGVAMLAKGPSGLAFPAAAVVLFLVWSRRPGLLLSRGAVLGVVAFVLVAAPWYVWVGVETKWAFLREFFLTHNVERALTPMENHSGPPFYYLLVLLVGLAPWSVFLGLAVWYGGLSAVRAPLAWLRPAWERGRDDERGAHPDPAAAYRYLACWVVVYLIVFTAARTKLPNYVLPIAPPLALLTGRFLDRWRRGTLQMPAWVMPSCWVCLALVGALTAVGLLLASGALPFVQRKGRAVPGLEVWAAMGLVPVAAAALAWWLHRRGQRGRIVTVVALSAVVYLAPLAAWAAAAVNGQKAARPLVETAGALRHDNEMRIATYGLDHLPSLNFYCQRNVLVLTADEEALEQLRYPIPVYLFTTEARWQQLQGRAPSACRVAARHRELYRGGVAVVVTNR